MKIGDKLSPHIGKHGHIQPVSWLAGWLNQNQTKTANHSGSHLFIHSSIFQSSNTKYQQQQQQQKQPTSQPHLGNNKKTAKTQQQLPQQQQQQREQQQQHQQKAFAHTE